VDLCSLCAIFLPWRGLSSRTPLPHRPVPVLTRPDLHIVLFSDVSFVSPTKQSGPLSHSTLLCVFFSMQQTPPTPNLSHSFLAPFIRVRGFPYSFPAPSPDGEADGFSWVIVFRVSFPISRVPSTRFVASFVKQCLPPPRLPFSHAIDSSLVASPSLLLVRARTPRPNFFLGKCLCFSRRTYRVTKPLASSFPRLPISSFFDAHAPLHEISLPSCDLCDLSPPGSPFRLPAERCPRCARF